MSAWRAVRLLLAVLCGAGLALAYPPFDFVPALASYAALLVLIELSERHAKRPILDRFVTGAVFGFGFHLAGLWWVGAAFLVDADRYALLLPLGVVGLPLLLAPFMGLATALTGLAPRTMAWRALALALAISFAEALRSVVFTGFPWNHAGAGLSQSLLLSQTASAVGLNGLAIAAVLVGALPAVLVERKSRWFGVPVGVVLALMAGYGLERLWTAPPDAPDAFVVRIVQPNVPQRDKWDPQHRFTIWARLLDLTAGARPGAIVIWPETAIPFIYRTESLEQVQLAEALTGKALLITGAADIVGAKEGRPVTKNAVLTIATDGSITDRYDKARLVPFGEFVPLAGLLERIGLRAIAAGNASFTPGPGPVVLRSQGVPPFQPLICYEIIFSDPSAPEGAEWIVNVTNDAWFGDTPGPRQHLRHAQLRAIERGLPLVRAANTGISALVDATGAIREALPLNATGVIDARLPAARSALYERAGDLPLYALWLIAIGAALAWRLKRIRDS